MLDDTPSAGGAPNQALTLQTGRERPERLIALKGSDRERVGGRVRLLGDHAQRVPLHQRRPDVREGPVHRTVVAVLHSLEKTTDFVRLFHIQDDITTIQLAYINMLI